MTPKVKQAVAAAVDRLKAAGVDPATVDADDPSLAPYGITPAVAKLCRKFAKRKARRRLGVRP